MLYWHACLIVKIGPVMFFFHFKEISIIIDWNLVEAYKFEQQYFCIIVLNVMRVRAC